MNHKIKMLKVKEVTQKEIVFELNRKVNQVLLEDSFGIIVGDITLTRGANHICSFVEKFPGDEKEYEQSFKWGPAGSDRLPQHYVNMKQMLIKAAQEAGINFEVDTYMKPLDVIVIFNHNYNKWTVEGIYPVFGKQSVACRFKTEAEAKAFAEKLLNNVQNKYIKQKEELELFNEENKVKLTKENRPQGYVTKAEEKANKQNNAKKDVDEFVNQVKQKKKEGNFIEASEEESKLLEIVKDKKTVNSLVNEKYQTEAAAYNIIVQVETIKDRFEQEPSIIDFYIENIDNITGVTKVRVKQMLQDKFLDLPILKEYQKPTAALIEETIYITYSSIDLVDVAEQKEVDAWLAAFKK